MLSHMVGRNLR
uniref:Uncharacterized protein n=1 Tax=Arundo donax TaxID=35708 RepID=A0A0A8ZPG8_ARUDO